MPARRRAGRAQWRRWTNPTTEAHATGRLRVLVLGSTGSIGTQALEVIAEIPTASRWSGWPPAAANLDTLRQQRAETGVTNIAVADERAAGLLGDVPFHGPSGHPAVEETEADVVLNALVGALGLRPTLAALQSGAGWRWPTRSR